MNTELTLPVEIIVPIHNAAALVQSCLDSLLRHLPASTTVQLVDDASTQEEIWPLLEQHPLRKRAGVQCLRNDRNLGFVATVNQAIGRCNGDVVLLNSDTRVTSHWLSRMQRCALSAPDVASVTPWSNNAEICSLPDFCRAAPPPADADGLAIAIAGQGVPDYPPLPTAVGFCMYIRRHVWDRIGGFDAATFGRGYGEENDWCMRAVGHGYRHLLCDDAYVVHAGGASFAGTGHQSGGEQLRRLLSRYPYYNATVADFIERDPLASRRQALISAPGVASALSP